MFTVTVGQYAVSVQQGTLPTIYRDYKIHAKLADEFALLPHAGELCFVCVSDSRHWPTLVITQRYEPAEAGYDPAVLLVPETHTLFIGAGRRLLAYRVDTPQRLWEDVTEAGFWEWNQYDDTVLMSGELELAAWNLRGEKLWTMPLRPAWDYHVDHGQVHVDQQGRKSVFALREGPSYATPER